VVRVGLAEREKFISSTSTRESTNKREGRGDKIKVAYDEGQKEDPEPLEVSGEGSDSGALSHDERHGNRKGKIPVSEVLVIIWSWEVGQE
jgi:hypothetical protein